MEEKVVEDTRSVTAVEGTKATLTFRLNKPVAEATLVPREKKPEAEAGDKAPEVAAPAGAPAPVALSRDSSDPGVYHVSVDLNQSQAYRLQLKDEQGRQNKQQPELVLNVVP